uniref:mitochondrial import receptor subunit TOM5 homolog n=1 Tax=Jaculus jaculus TaxID=51337 RepID=UPI001E1B2BE8|nr:mitochondrial import receptor subunit TOM5 homolog [Jaculus jaculus]
MQSIANARTVRNGEQEGRGRCFSASWRGRARLVWVEGLLPKLDPEKMKRNMPEEVLSSIKRFLTYMALFQVTPFLLKKLHSI